MKFEKTIKLGLAGIMAIVLASCINNESASSLSADEKSLAEDMGAVLVSGVNTGALGSALETMGQAPGLGSARFSSSADIQQGGLSKTSVQIAAEPVYTVDTLEDGNRPRLLITAVEDAPFYIKTDSIWMVIENGADTSIEKLHSVKQYKSSLKKEEVLITDADGDGIAAGLPVYNNRADVVFTNVNVLGVQEKSNIRIDAGPDKDFGENGNPAEKDNMIIVMKWEKTNKDGELLASAEYIDADGDGIIVDGGSDEVTVVDVSISDYQKLFVQSASLNMRVEVVAGRENDGRIIKMSGTEVVNDHRTNRIVVKNSSGGEIFEPDAEALHVHISTEYLDNNAEMSKTEAMFVIAPGAGLNDESDNMLLSIHVVSTPRFGEVKAWTLDFVSDAPIPDGQEPVSGSIEMRAEYKDNTTASLVGTFSPSGYEVVITDRGGNKITVKLDANGKL